MRIFTGWFAINTPYTWLEFSTRFSDRDGVIGKKFFKEFAAKTHASLTSKTQYGLIDSLKSLNCSGFNHEKVDPLIRDFYENTYDYSMRVRIRWNPVFRPLGYLYRLCVGKEAKQLLVPLDNEGQDQLDSWVDSIDDVSTNRCPDYRCWIRIDRQTQRPIYVGAYKTFKARADGRAISFVSIAFPILKGNLTTVLRPLNFRDGGLKLTTRNTRSTDTGVYLVFPHKKSFSMITVPGLSEQWELVPCQEHSEDRHINVTHKRFWLGIKAFEIKYKISKKPSAVQLFNSSVEKKKKIHVRQKAK